MEPRTLTAALLITGLATLALGAPAHAATPRQCTMRLDVELTPDVPNPQDAAFLSSLLSNHPGYQLDWVRQAGDFDIVVDLIGPGPEAECRNVVRTMRNDGRVLAIHTDSETNVRVSDSGIGSLFWAASHPAQAWKILAPVGEVGELDW
jgi:hypothetical protein